jgi:Zn-dependent protease with chaperone function
LGQHLTKTQMDYVMAHELAHVKLRHGRKDLLLLLAIYSAFALILFELSQHAMALHPLAEFTVIFGPLVAIYYLSRCFEYDADRVAVDFTGEPEIAIRALANLYTIQALSARRDRFTGLFMTHPSFADRVQAIARDGRVPRERLGKIMDDVFGVHQGFVPQR